MNAHVKATAGRVLVALCCVVASGVVLTSRDRSGARLTIPGAVAAKAVAGVAPGRFVPVAPVRIVDTRSGLGVDAGRRSAGSSTTFAVVGRAGVPADATAAVVNVTATGTTAAGYVQVFPAGQAVAGTSSTLNVESAGSTVPNLAIVGLGDGGALTVHVQSGTDLVVDLFGYFLAAPAAVAGGRYVPLASPRRALDTRSPASKLGPGATRQLAMTATAGGPVPDGSTAVAMNVTATDATGPGFVQVVPTGGGTALGSSSNLNLERAGQTVANLVIAPVGADGSVTFYSQRGTHLVVDVAGYFTGPHHAVSTDGLFRPMVPARLLDTRGGAAAVVAGPVGAGATVVVPALGTGGVPSTDVAAVVLNATIDQATAPGYVQVFPTGRAEPGSSSTLNAEHTGQTRANAAITAVGDGGTFSIRAQSGGQLLADATGWFTGVPPVAPPGTGPPTTSPSGTIWKPALQTSWQWMITHPLDLANPKDMGTVDPNGNPLTVEPPTVYDVDLFTTTAAQVAALHAAGRRVICYVSVGAWEDFRPDKDTFPPDVLGSSNGWPGERWLDIRRLDALLPILGQRLDLCRQKGFDAVEPDNVDGYANTTGFPLTAGDQLTFNRAIGDLAHSMGLSVGLKNDLDQVPALLPSFDFAVNEQCFEFGECDTLRPFVAAGKAVFEVEYSGTTSNFCPQARRLRLSSMLKRLALDPWREVC